MLRYDDSMPMGVMTIGDLRELITEILDSRHSVEQESHSKNRRLVYGLRGIQELFKVSHKTAQQYKDGILKPAVKQNGRKIVVDADLALELFERRKNVNNSSHC